MLQREHSAIRSTFISLTFSIKTFVLSIFKRPLETGLTAFCILMGRRLKLLNSVHFLANSADPDDAAFHLGLRRLLLVSSTERKG